MVASVLEIKSKSISVSTKGNTDVIDVTTQMERFLKEEGAKQGILTVFVVGSTAGLTTIEYEPGLVHPLKEAFERMAAREAPYKHQERWGDDNGHSHIRASLLGPSLTVPFLNGKLCLGTWQQIILVDFDTRPRERELIVQIFGN